MRGQISRVAVALFGLLALLAQVGAPLTFAQGINATQLCYTEYTYANYAQYALIGFALVLALIALAPIILSRTALAPLFGEIQTIAAIGLLLIIFLGLAVFPITPLFVYATSSSSGSTINIAYGAPPTPGACTISFVNYVMYGPPAARLFAWILQTFYAIPVNTSALTTT